jgi:hypothetical protein
MERYEAIIKLIEENSDKVEFGEFGSGCSDFWINKAQEHLNIIFPPSYIWWLKNYGGGYTLGDEIYSIYEMEYGTLIGGDIIYMNELDRKNGFADNSQITIQTNDRAETYYFDLLQANENGEFPVYCKVGRERFRYADDFLGFLSGRIQDKY